MFWPIPETEDEIAFSREVSDAHARAADETIATLRARIAELEAENQKLLRTLEGQTDAKK